MQCVHVMRVCVAYAMRTCNARVAYAMRTCNARVAYAMRRCNARVAYAMRTCNACIVNAPLNKYLYIKLSILYFWWVSLCMYVIS